MNYMGRWGVYSSAAYLFFMGILFQNTVALALVGSGLYVPLAVPYGAKYALLVCLIVFLLITKSVYRFGGTEKIALSIIIVVTGLAITRGGGIAYQANELRFYLGPLVLFLIGRSMAPFKSEKQVAVFIMTLGLIYVLLGLSYAGIERKTLLNGGMGLLLERKLSDIGRGQAVFKGMPTNFYYFHGGTAVTERAFGALFDPLASAFFGATLLFYLLEIHKRRVLPWAGSLAFIVASLIVLSLTRSIIMGIAVVFFASWIHRKGIGAFPLWPVFLLLLLVGFFLVTNLKTVEPYLDPSSLAHLNAYLQLDHKMVLLGGGMDKTHPRGAEGLYLTILKEYGVGVLLLFSVWFSLLYRHLRKHITYSYARASLESMFVYLVASLTTEHWFIFSSGALFWYLLGNNMTAIEYSKRIAIGNSEESTLTSSRERREKCITV